MSLLGDVFPHRWLLKVVLTCFPARENSQDIEADESNDNGLVSAPMGTLFEVTKLRNLRSNPRATHGNVCITCSSLKRCTNDNQNVERPSMEEDFIATGQVGLEDAERLFDRFNRTLNHYLWGGIALVYGDLASVRRFEHIFCLHGLANGCVKVFKPFASSNSHGDGFARSRHGKCLRRLLCRIRQSDMRQHVGSTSRPGWCPSARHWSILALGSEL